MQRSQAGLKNNPKIKILLGVTGGIACYKSCEIVRLLKQADYDVHCVLTSAAREFVTPLTFQALSGQPVRTGLFDLSEESAMSHIQLADQSDLILIAPATADFIAKIAYGHCSDLLSTLVCAAKAPIWVAPSMNVNMWENRITQENVSKLIRVGHQLIGPEEGELACGWQGMGRMAAPEKIAEKVIKHCSRQ